MRRSGQVLVIAGSVLAAIALLIIAFLHGQDSQCGYYQNQGGPQWALDKYCGPQH